MSQSEGPTQDGSAPDPAAPAHGEASPQSEGNEADAAQVDGPVEAGAGDPTGASAGEGGDPDVDSDVVEAVELAQKYEAERDEYLDHLRRLQAEFENFKRRVETQASEVRDRAAADLVRELLPVLDTCDAAVSHGNEEVAPVRTQLLQTLEKQGLQTVGEDNVAFDPNIHEAVMHEPGEGDAVVVEVMRTGYIWNNNVVRAAMVKVRG